MGVRRIMDAMKDGPRSTLSSGKVVALAAGLSVGATLGYMVYRHVRGSRSSEYQWGGWRVLGDCYCVCHECVISADLCWNQQVKDLVPRFPRSHFL